LIDRAANGTHQLGDFLPLVQEDGFEHGRQSGIGVSVKRCCLCRDIQLDHRAGQPPGGGRLASGTGTNHKQGRQLGEEILQGSINQPGYVRNRSHTITLAL